jgi:hypothetical protein
VDKPRAGGTVSAPGRKPNLQLLTDVGENHDKQMSKQTEQVPTAPATVVAQTPVPAAVARTSDNLTGAELVAALSKRRASVRAASPATTPPITDTQPAIEAPAVTPEPETAIAPDESNATSTPEEAAPAADAEAELTTPDAAGEPPAETSQDSAEDEPKGIKPLLKRVDTLTARLRETEAERDSLKQQLAKPAEQPAPVPTVAREGEFGHMPVVQQVNTELAKWRAVEQWTAENPDGGEILDAAGKVLQTVSPEEARRTRLQADEKLAELRATRAVLVQNLKAQDATLRQQAEARAVESFAWLKDQSDPKTKTLEEIVALVPEIQRLPGWKLIAAHGIEGYNRSLTKTATPVTRPNPPKVAVPAGATAPRVNPVQKQLAEAEAAFEKSGSSKDYQRVQQLRREMRGRT